MFPDAEGRATASDRFGGPPNTKSIADMAVLYGVTLRTLRFYEDKGLLFPLRIGLARYYSPKDEVKLQLIQTGKRLGFSLAEIQKLIIAAQPANHGTEMPTLPLSRKQIEEKLAALEKLRTRVVGALEELYVAQRGARSGDADPEQRDG